MKLNFEISRLALKDLDDIWVYTAEQWSIQQANKYYKEIFIVINEICTHSEIGIPIDDIKKGHRKIPIKSHLIIYKVKQQTICVDRILHQKMDYDNN